MQQQMDLCGYSKLRYVISLQNMPYLRFGPKSLEKWMMAQDLGTYVQTVKLLFELWFYMKNRRLQKFTAEYLLRYFYNKILHSLQPCERLLT